MHFTNGDAEIHYEIEGVADGHPVLLIAPGGMMSTNDKWSAMPWNPRTALAADYRLIGMDQRNAGGSTAPVLDGDGWSSHTSDQLALLDHLGIERCAVIGMCIGGPYIAALLQAAPDRFSAGVMLQPVGVDDNRHAFYQMFDSWASVVAEAQPDVTDETWQRYRSAMWDGEFLLTATPDDVAGWDTPLLVACGNDLYHPLSTSYEIAELAKKCTFIERWKDDEVLAETDTAIKAFLAAQTL